MPGPNLTPDPLAAALAKLRPAPAAAERPAFLFLAGQASRDGIVRRWRWLAGVAVALLVGSWAVGLAVIREALRRTETAETRLRDATAPPAVTVPTVPPAPAIQPSFTVPAPPPTPAPVPSYDPDPTPQELADALRQRNDILTAGLTLLPAARPPERPAPNDIRHLLPGGVYAAPRIEPKSGGE